MKYIEIYICHITIETIENVKDRVSRLITLILDEARTTSIRSSEKFLSQHFPFYIILFYQNKDHNVR